MKTERGKIASMFILFLFFTTGLSAQSLNIFVSPHPDDWQLFMNPNAFYRTAQSDQKVIFLHTTAGDGGYGDTTYNSAREAGSLRAIRFMVSSTAYLKGTNTNPVMANINGHNISKHTYGNAVVYFLRLPDGQGGGAGFPSNNNQSLYKLVRATIPSITAIDNSTTYNSKADLETTLKQIIISESSPNDSIFIHCADTDINFNPGDHSDHYVSSEIMQMVGATLNKVKFYLYQDYVTDSRPQNLFGNDFLLEAATWGVTNSGLTDFYTNSTFHDDHNNWVGKQYFRIINLNTPEIDSNPPTAPSNVTALAVTSTSVNLNWGASTDNVGVTGYSVYRNNILVNNSSALTYLDNGLSPSTSYSYSVRAYDAAGNLSPLSQTINVTTLQSKDSIAPTVPGNLTASAVTYKSVHLSWDASTDNVGVTGYSIYRNNVFVFNTKALAFTDSSLAPNSAYSYTIQANDAEGNLSLFSAPLDITTLADTEAPSIPSNLLATAGSTTSIGLSWSASIDDVGVTGYTLFRDNVQLTTTTLLSYTDNTLLPGTTYTYSVRASDASGNQSPLSSTVSATTLIQSPNLALNKPTTASSYEYQDASFAVNGNYDKWDFWSASPYTQWWRVDLQNEYLLNKVVVVTYYDGGRYYKYDIQVSLDGVNWLPLVDFNNNTAPATASGNSFDINNVKARYIRVNMNYNSSNRGVHIIEFEAYGSLASSSQNDVISPSIPTNLNASVTPNNQIALSWSASNDNIGVSGYSIYRNSMLLTNTTSLNYTDNTVMPGTVYNYGVRAYDAAGNQSEISPIVAVNIPIQSVNLALNKPSIASGFEYQDASYAVNGNYDRWDFWSASPYPQWWRVDLQNEYILNKIVVVTYYDGSRYYRYDVEISTDGVNWAKIVDFNNNTSPATAEGNSFIINNVAARYIRVNMNYNSSNRAVHIIEFEAYGTSGTVQSSSINSVSQNSIAFALSPSEPITSSLSNTSLLETSDTQKNQIVSIYPNPVINSQGITVLYNSISSEKVTVSIYSTAGFKLYDIKTDVLPGSNEIKLSLPDNLDLEGIYLITVDSKLGQEVKKVVFE